MDSFAGIRKTLDPNCPHVVPSLDHESGYYCTREELGCDRFCVVTLACPIEEGGADCHNETSSESLSDSDAKPGVSGDGGQRPGGSCEGITGDQLAHPKPAIGDVIQYQGRSMVVYNQGYKGDFIWLTEVGGYTALPYPWPEAIAGGDQVQDGSLSDAGPTQLTIMDAIAALVGPSETLSDSDAKPGVWQICETYVSKGRHYYRYRWGQGADILGVRHIPGGSITRSVVKGRAQAVDQAIREGKPPEAIAALIDGWRGQSRSRDRIT